MRIKRLRQRNTSLEPSFEQWVREMICGDSDHVFYVAWGSGYIGLPQSHCYRCGLKSNEADPSCPKWIRPIG